MRDATVIYVLAGLVVFVFLAGLFSIHKIIDKHQLPSILEGGDLVKYYQVSAKNKPYIRTFKAIPDPHQPQRAIESGDTEELDEER